VSSNPLPSSGESGELRIAPSARYQLSSKALNYALAAIPPERVRMHLCNYKGLHYCDVPLAEIIGIAFEARPATISFEAANPRHAHEWTLFERVKLPGGAYACECQGPASAAGASR
jgi:5-methyltetrahydropteroyltriglutamate--homocysteine methyltransferase